MNESVPSLPAVLTFAASDPTSGAGLQADLLALASMGCTPHEAVMVGDDAESDIAGAAAVKMKAVLVRTGKYETGAETAYALPPTYLADDLAAAADWILAGNS